MLMTILRGVEGKGLRTFHAFLSSTFSSKRGFCNDLSTACTPLRGLINLYASIYATLLLNNLIKVNLAPASAYNQEVCAPLKKAHGTEASFQNVTFCSFIISVVIIFFSSSSLFSQDEIRDNFCRRQTFVSERELKKIKLSSAVKEKEK